MSVVTPLFEIKDLHVQATVQGENEPLEILSDINIKVMPGEVHALLGPNGSGKSTLAATLLGAPTYQVAQGTIGFRGDDITDWPTDVRAKAGLFLGFQDPQEISGVSFLSFLRQALSAQKGTEVDVLELSDRLEHWLDRLEMDQSFMSRFVNDGFSTGEKKRSEVLQMALLEPEMAVLDETDAGLDAAALRTVAKCINEIRASRPQFGALAITHSQHLLEHLNPDVIHVLIDGKITTTGGPELANQLQPKAMTGSAND